MDQEPPPSPPPTLADGTRLHLYRDGAALTAALHAIHNARRLIGLEVYIFRNDQTGKQFAAALSQKARQGVRVFLIYDSFGSWDTPAALFDEMKSAGVHVTQFHPLWPWDCRSAWRPANRDHRKLLVVDDQIAGLGGLNIGDEYAGSGKTLRWRDNAVGIIGPSSRLFSHAFAHTWHYCRRGGRIRQAEFIAHSSPSQGHIGVMASVPSVNSKLRPWLCNLMRQAQHSIDLTMAYFAPDDQLMEELYRAARRGVRLRLLLPGRSDHPLLHIAAQGFYESLMTNNAEIYEWPGEMLHAKTMVLDAQTTILGSLNLDQRSIEYNLELSAIISSQSFAQDVTALFEDDIRLSRRITPENWRRRPIWDRFVQWSVTRARYWL